MKSAEDMVRYGATVHQLNEWVSHHLSGDWFTGHLLRLIAKADGYNRAKLGEVYPHELDVWTHWSAQIELEGREVG